MTDKIKNWNSSCTDSNPIRPPPKSPSHEGLESWLACALRSDQMISFILVLTPLNDWHSAGYSPAKPYQIVVLGTFHPAKHPCICAILEPRGHGALLIKTQGDYHPPLCCAASFLAWIQVGSDRYIRRPASSVSFDDLRPPSLGFGRPASSIVIRVPFCFFDTGVRP